VLLGAFAFEASVADAPDLLSFDAIDEFIVATEGLPHLFGDEFPPFLFYLVSGEKPFGVTTEILDQLEVVEE
jgi:hypothetical protein